MSYMGKLLAIGLMGISMNINIMQIPNISLAGHHND